MATWTTCLTGRAVMTSRSRCRTPSASAARMPASCSSALITTKNELLRPEVQMEPLNIGTVLPLQLENEMRSSYMDYAMSVIVSRALPDATDGLQPRHSRLLYC